MEYPDTSLKKDMIEEYCRKYLDQSEYCKKLQYLSKYDERLHIYYLCAFSDLLKIKYELFFEILKDE